MREGASAMVPTERETGAVAQGAGTLRTSIVLPDRFRAVVFDVDGVLVATEPAWEAAERDLLARHGQEMTEEDRLATIGRSVESTIATYGARIGLGEDGHESLRVELLELLRKRLPAVHALPGARRLVDDLMGVLPIGVASASPRAIVEAALSACGLAGAFDVVVTSDDVAAKPAPDAYLLACRLLGVSPGDAIAFEDSKPGVESALAAGLFTVAVPWRPDVDVSAAHVIIPSLEAVRVQVARDQTG